ncbi:uncharacterized protein METZ01_LOCUS128232, partial [marine metagenome]
VAEVGIVVPIPLCVVVNSADAAVTERRSAIAPSGVIVGQQRPGVVIVELIVCCPAPASRVITSALDQREADKPGILC